MTSDKYGRGGGVGGGGSGDEEEESLNSTLNNHLP